MFRTPLSLDRTQRSLTLIAGGLLLLGLGVALRFDKPAVLGAVAFAAVALAAAWAMGPRALVVTSGELRIERRAWPSLRVLLTDVVSAGALANLGNPLRLVGVGVFFGNYGLLRSDALGRFRLYATRGDHCVIVRRKEGALPIVLTPDDVAGAIDAINSRVHEPT
jgi:hypothetical protein